MERIPRYKLQIKDSIVKAIDPLVSDHLKPLIKSVDYDVYKLDPSRQREIMSFVEMHTYDFNFIKMFKNLNSHNQYAQQYDRRLLQFYLHLYFNNEPLNHFITNKILSYWNNVDNPKFTKHVKIKDQPDSKSYGRVLILTNYILKVICNNDISYFFTIIDRIDKFGHVNYYLANSLQKWRIDQILMAHNVNGMKKYFIHKDESSFENDLFNYRSKHTDASKRWKEIFIKSFYRDNPQKAKDVYDRFQSKLDAFLDILINRMRQYHRELYQFNLTQTKVIDGYEMDSILGLYCDWFSYSLSSWPDMTELCNYQNFMQFVYQEMRGVKGYQKFWQPIK